MKNPHANDWNDWAKMARNLSLEDLKESILSGYKSGKPFAPTELLLLGYNKLESVLDFGCGLGRNFPKLKAISKNVYGYDLADMLDAYVREGADPEVSLHYSWDVARASRYDLTLASLVLQHIPDKKIITDILRDLSLCSTCLYVGTRNYTDTTGHNVIKLIHDTGYWDILACNANLSDVLHNTPAINDHFAAVFKTNNKQQLSWAGRRPDVRLRSDD